MKARDVSFFKKTWKDIYSGVLTIPVEALADKCFGSWLDIEDTNFAEATLPDKKLAGRFRELVDSDAEQAEWDEFYASVDKAFSAMPVDELASKFVELNDPANVYRVLWGYEDKWYLDSDCEYEY